ncbi:MAG TPA: hypothetical protein VJS87_00880, partial [Solirubrobacterales bacterium]|nr:hypothetical protein [Solirubrobacterales bacterium]
MTESQPPSDDATGAPGGDPPPAAEPAMIPPGYIVDPVTGQTRPMSFMERARVAASQAAKIGAEVGGQAAKVGVEVGGQAARVGADLGSKAAHQAATTIRDPANQARARSALKKAKRGFTTALERIDPKILADVVVKATSLQERANASLQSRGSVYRIGEIAIGASIPPSITFTIERVDDPDKPGLSDSQTLMALAEAEAGTAGEPAEAIVTLDGTAID